MPLGVLLSGLLLPGTALAQARGWTVSASAGVNAAYDDNIFSDPTTPVGDYIGGISASLLTTFEPGRKLNLSGGYSLASELFRQQPELNSALARQTAFLGLTYELARKTKLIGRGSYYSTVDLSSLVDEVATDLGRGRGERLLLSLGLSQQIGRRDSVTLSYGRNLLWYIDETQQADAVTLGWTHQLTRSTSLTVSGGPRYADEEVRWSAHGLASLRFTFRDVDAFISYRHGRTAVPTDARETDTDTVFADLTRRFARNRFQVGIDGMYSRNRDEAGTSTTYRVGTTVNARLISWLGLQSRYYHTWTNGTVDLRTGLAGPAQTVRHNRFIVGLLAGHTFQFR